MSRSANSTYLLSFVLLLGGCLLSLCACERDAQPTPRPHATRRQPPRTPMTRPTPPPFQATWHQTPKQAFEQVLQEKPTILGLGEIHQVHRLRHIPSAIQRFHQTLLQSLWGSFTDLIVETWRTTGSCGKSEVKVVKQVRKLIKRPKKVLSQIELLLRSSSRLGVQPHILTVHCKTYQELMKARGTNQTRQLILLVTRLLLQKTREIVRARRKRKQRPAIVLYGGALHNDLYPSPSLAHYSYVPKLLKQINPTKMKYIELDLYVPEYLDDDMEWRTKAWYPLYLKQQHTQKTLLIKRAPRSYVLVFPWTKQAPKTKKRPSPPKR